MTKLPDDIKYGKESTHGTDPLNYPIDNPEIPLVDITDFWKNLWKIMGDNSDIEGSYTHTISDLPLRATALGRELIDQEMEHYKVTGHYNWGILTASFDENIREMTFEAECLDCTEDTEDD